ncbi:hypothetical protein RRG08_066988 [Elysia crispata]|uniref:Uncharacterized protein n=1 Tax=Elysia crispata TaxID=231223 RepID=A0AAE0ZAP9_9GAST|nr:hypothetical protein RRG08_066988 [Elysia crispata]
MKNCQDCHMKSHARLPQNFPQLLACGLPVGPKAVWRRRSAHSITSSSDAYTASFTTLTSEWVELTSDCSTVKAGVHTCNSGELRLKECEVTTSQLGFSLISPDSANLRARWTPVKALMSSVQNSTILLTELSVAFKI